MPYRADLESEVNGLEYSFHTRQGRLFVPANGGADMEGAVRLFSLIDPHVQRISTLAGLEQSTVYDRGVDGWEARRIEPTTRAGRNKIAQSTR
jgi:hypothetical protein